MPTPADTNLRPMSTPLGEKTLAMMPVPLDNLAAHPDAGYECLKGGQSYLLAPPLERLVQLGGVDSVQPDQPPGHDDGVAVDDLGVAEKVLPPKSPLPCALGHPSPPESLKRGISPSLLASQEAINRFGEEHNRDPSPFVWTADPDAIVKKVRRGYHTLASIGRQPD